MDDREQQEIEAKILEDEAKRDREIQELLKAWENYRLTTLEALGIPSIVSWLADKLNKIIGK